jgi:hypothetical protein
MTSQSPRIYIYKITFEEVPYYYYGVKKEKKYNECYMGSPVTHKWCWELYTPEKQILQLFDFTDEGWNEAQEVEKRLIRPFYNTDKWCLNENVGGQISLDVCRKTGKKCAKLKLGFYNMSEEERIAISKKVGNENKILNRGICALTKEQRIENGKKYNHLGGYKSKKLKVGIHGLSKEERVENSKKMQKICKENKTGIWKFTEEERKQRFYENCGNVNKIKWMCLETGHISTPGPLTNYQRARNIDTSKRKRVD